MKEAAKIMVSLLSIPTMNVPGRILSLAHMKPSSQFREVLDVRCIYT